MSDEDVLIQNCACSNNFESASVKGIWLCCTFSLCVKLCVHVLGKYPGSTSFVYTRFI